MSYRANRPSPSVSATLYDPGDRMRGNDGNMYQIIQSYKGTNRWSKLARDSQYDLGGQVLHKVREPGEVIQMLEDTGLYQDFMSADSDALRYTIFQNAEDIISKGVYAKGGKITLPYEFWGPDGYWKVVREEAGDETDKLYVYLGEEVDDDEWEWEMDDDSYALSTNLDGVNDKDEQEVLKQILADYKAEDYAKGGKVEGYDIDDVVSHYLDAMLFSSTDDDNEDAEYLDELHDRDDVEDKFKKVSAKKIKEFIRKNKSLLKKHNISGESVGHDLWYTPNGHGVGFWDRGYGDDGDKLTKSSEEIMGGTKYPYSQDGKVGVDGGSYAKGGKIDKDIAKFKKQLIAKEKSRGLYENFGQKEVRKLNDKYDAYEMGDDGVKNYTKIQQFSDWASGFDGTRYAKGGYVLPKHIKERIDKLKKQFENEDISETQRDDLLYGIKDDYDLNDEQLDEVYEYADIYAKGGEVKKGNEMIIGGLAGFLLGMFFVK